MLRPLTLGLLTISLGVLSIFAYTKYNNHSSAYATMHEMHHGKSAQRSDNKMQTHMHDEMNMPGLQGKDTTETEVSDLRMIFQQHTEIKRSVSNLPNGISTLTETRNPELRDAIVSHVSMMITRLAEGKNPEVIIQSTTLDALFDVHNEIETEIELTDEGVTVRQTSTNPKVALLLQQHAAEVSDMSERGMQSVHDRMDSF